MESGEMESHKAWKDWDGERVGGRWVSDDDIGK